MDYSSFSHGQIHSKLWLCKELEKFIIEPINVAILASWYNVLGFMLLSRNDSLYKKIHGIEINESNIQIANKICDAWMINDDQKIKNYNFDVNEIDYENYDLIINTSVEDILSNSWYEKIPYNKLVCLQTIDLTQMQVDRYKDWHILNPNTNMDTFKKKYHLSDILFEGIKKFDYGDLKYNRYMLIGRK